MHCKKQPEFSLFGFYLQNLDDLIPDNLFLPKDLYAQAYGDSFCYYHLGDGFYIFLIDNNKVETFTQAFIDRHQFLGSLTWHTLRLYKQQISIYPETRGLFLPHRIDLHQSSYLSFNKGCYKGQEIIARTHYRATLKHTLNLYVAHTKEPLFSGEKLYKADEEKEVGELIDYSYLSDNKYLIAVSILKEASNEVRLEKQDQVITLEQV